jgi:hypothetical protein
VKAEIDPIPGKILAQWNYLLPPFMAIKSSASYT